MPTMLVMVFVASLVLAVSLAAIAFRRHVELGTWVAALALNVLAYVLLALRGQVPDLLSIVGGNVAGVAVLSMYAAGVLRFDGRPVPAWILVAPSLVTAVGFTWLLDDFRGRLWLGGVILLAQAVLLVVLLLRRRRVGRGQYLLVAAAVLYAMAMAYRLFSLIIGSDHATGLMDPTPVSVLNFVAGFGGTLMLAVGALAMFLERAQQTAVDNEQRYRTLIDAATEGIMVLQDGLARMVNPKLCAMMGATEADLLGRHFADFVHPEDLEAARQSHDLRLHGLAEGMVHAVRVQTPSRGLRWFQVSGVAFEWQGQPATLNFLSDVTEQREAAEQIRQLAFHDPLTGLPNRRLFRDRLQQALAAGTRHVQQLAIVFIDLDNFKTLNDRHGHAVGDQLLVEVARRLRSRLRAMDTAARFGGDEFVLLLTELGHDRAVACAHAARVTEQVLALLARPYELTLTNEGRSEPVQHHCTGSAGVVVGAGAGQDLDALLDRADAAMYRAKQAGRNRLVLDAAEGPAG